MPIISQLLIHATNNSHPSDLGNFTASSAINVTSANKYLNVNGATLTANGTGTAVDITSKYLSGSGSVSTLMEFGEQLIQKPQHLEDFLEDLLATLSNMVIPLAMQFSVQAVDC